MNPKKNIGLIISVIITIVIVILFLYRKKVSHLSKIPVTQQQSKESCTACHTGMTGFVPAHNPEVIGCTPCHLGNPQSGEKEAAHKNMVVIPGNLADASATCSAKDCHQGIDIRVKKSLMNTMSGVVAVDKYVFGEGNSLDDRYDVNKIGKSASETHLKNLCASCHLGREKLETGAIHEKSRGGGCNACHLNYNEQTIKAHEAYLQSGKKELPASHPSLSLKITNDHCFGCHSRSGRISTNYEGWHETKLRSEEVKDNGAYRVLEDKRVFTYVREDVHHTAGLDCIDCHSALDVMGNGVAYAHENEAVSANCEDCHTREIPKIIPFEKLDASSKSIVKLRGIAETKRFVVSPYSKMPIVNVFLDDHNRLTMVGKNTGKKYSLSSPGQKCTKGGVHADITCSACHTSWAPQCIQCHTSYDREKSHFDLLDRVVAPGKWVEEGKHYLADYPALGVVEEDGNEKIKTFIPGMIMTLDKSGFTGKEKDRRNFRLYAPASPHTIAAKGQGCKDCHNNPVVLGYGRGELNYSKGRWTFAPHFERRRDDNLPLDAWIGFLQSPDTTNVTTRTNARPFSLEEQKRILRVGACLTCHDEDTTITRDMLNDFSETLKNRSEKCELPEW